MTAPGSIAEAVETVRPFYHLGRHHGYRLALEDLRDAMTIREVTDSTTLAAWLNDTRATLEECHVD